MAGFTCKLPMGEIGDNPFYPSTKADHSTKRLFEMESLYLYKMFTFISMLTSFREATGIG